MPSPSRAAIAVTLLAIESFELALARPTYDPLTVQTTNGPVTGHLATNTTSVSEFLGIPYAQPPVGGLRFSAPVNYSGYAPYEASQFGLDCPLTASPPVDFPGFTPQAPRIIKNFASGAGNPQGEDCLTLNIWTHSPSCEEPASLKPVLIFFYGGRFTIGNTNSPFYNGKYFAEAQDVVVVTLNYRLNIFGFPGVPGGVQNLGLRDQRMAVEWLRDNIKAFGGDPSKLTIFGQSSGGVAVDYWSYAYKQDPIVSSFISHSGNAFSFPLNDPELTVSNWYNVSSELGCGSAGDTLGCMREQNWVSIRDAAARVPSSSGGSPVRSVPAFYPSVDNQTVFADYEALSRQGSFARLGYYIIPAYAKGVNVTEAQGDEFLLESFTCPNMFEADMRRQYGVPVWQYRYFGDWSNIRLYNGSGAYHGSDLEMIFGNSQHVSGIPPSKPEIQTTSLMQQYWAAFATDPNDGLAKLGWPQYNPDSKSLIRLAYQNNPKPDFVKPGEYDAPCSNIRLGAL